MLPQPLNSSAISNGKLVDTWAKLKVYDLIDVILLEGAIRVRYTYLPFACPHVAHKGNYWLSSVLKLILVCIRNLVFMHNSSTSIDI
jgi:hypothetical protein